MATALPVLGKTVRKVVSLEDSMVPRLQKWQAGTAMLRMNQNRPRHIQITASAYLVVRKPNNPV